MAEQLLAISGLLLDKPLGMTDCLVGLVVAGKLAELVGISDWLLDKPLRMTDCLVGLVATKLAELVGSSDWLVDELAALAHTSIWLESRLAWIGGLSTLSASVIWPLVSIGTSVLPKSTELVGDSGLLLGDSNSGLLALESTKLEAFVGDSGLLAPESTELVGELGLLVPDSTELEATREFSSRETFLDLPLTRALLTCEFSGMSL